MFLPLENMAIWYRTPKTHFVWHLIRKSFLYIILKLIGFDLTYLI